MFKKRQGQIANLTSTIFDAIEKAKKKRETKIMNKLHKSIDKQLGEFCGKTASILIQKYINRIDEFSATELKELLAIETQNLVKN